MQSLTVIVVSESHYKTVVWEPFSTLLVSDKKRAWCEKVNEDLNREYGARFADLPPDLIGLLYEFRISAPLDFARLPMGNKHALAQNHGEAILWAMHKYYPAIFGQKMKGRWVPGLMAILDGYFQRYDAIDRFLIASDFRGMALTNKYGGNQVVMDIVHANIPKHLHRYCGEKMLLRRIERYFLRGHVLFSLKSKLPVVA